MSLPTHGQQAWDDDLNNFIEGVDSTATDAIGSAAAAAADAAQAKVDAAAAKVLAQTAKDTADLAKSIAQSNTGPAGPPGERGSQGAPGGSDAAFAGWISDGTSETRAAADAVYVQTGGVATLGNTTITGNFAFPGGGTTSRAPVNGSVVVDGTIAKNLPGDKVAYGLSSKVKGGFTGDTGNNPTFFWGADIFTTTGNTAGDVDGLNNITSAEVEVHHYTPGATLGTLKAGQFDCVIEASAAGSTVTSMFGLYVSALADHSVGSTVTNAYGLYIEAPLVGTNKYAILANGAVNVIGATTLNGAMTFTGAISQGGGAAKFAGAHGANSQGVAAGAYIGYGGSNTYGVNLSDGTNTFGIDILGTNLRFMKAGVSQLATIDTSGNWNLTGHVTMGDNRNLILNTTNGTKIGTATTQKLGFFNKTPIVQPASITAETALENLGLGATLFRKAINVKDYGALGDNSHDDTTNIHNARDAAGALGRDLYFPPGTYKNTGLIASVAKQRWILDPGATIMRPSTGTIHAIQVTADDVTIQGGTVDMTADTSFSGVFIGSGLSRVTVDGVYIIGSGLGVRVKGVTGPVTTKVSVRNCRIEGTASHGVCFNWETTDSEVRNCTITTTGAGADGVMIANSSTGCRIIDNRISCVDIGVEVQLSSTDATVERNTITSGFYGISISGSARGLVNDNRVTTTGTLAHGIEVVDSPSTTISDNHVKDVTGNAISLPTNIAGGGDYVVVKGNQLISPVGQAINGAGAGTSSHVSIQKNVIVNPGTAIAAIQCDVDDAGWSVENNKIIRTAAGPGAGPGINLGGVGNSIVGNTLYTDSAIVTAAGDQIRMACDDTICAGNTVTGNGKAGRGIVISATHTGCSVLANRISGTVTDGILISSTSTTNVVDGNTVNITSGGGINYGGASGTNWHGWVSRLVTTGAQQFTGNVGFNSATPVGKAANPGTATGTDAAVINAIVTALRNLGLVT